MATADIVARLQLRAEQFTSETGKAFADLNVRARSSAVELRNEFGGAFAEVQKLAQTALVLPRTASGSLNLTGEIAQLREAATATDQRAQALRELSIAQTAAAASANVDAQALRLEADASAVGALASERDAAAIRQRIVALEAVQGELNKTTSATFALNRAGQAYITSAGQQRASAISLGQQFSDFAVQVQSGQSAFVAFAQQAPQAGLALSGFKGMLGAVGTFLTGPWGIALTIGAGLLAQFVGKLFEAEQASKEAKAATEDLANYVGNIGNYFDTATGKIKETNAALIQFALLSANKRRTEAEEKQRAAQQAGNAALSSLPTGAPGIPGRSGIGDLYRPPVNRDVREVFASRRDIDRRLQQIANSKSSNAAAAAKILEQRTQFELARREVLKAEAEARSFETGKLDPSLRTPAKIKAPAKTRQAKSPVDNSKAELEKLQDQAAKAAETILRMNEYWGEQPTLINRANQDTRKLDDIIADLEKRKPPGFKEIIANARAAQGAIQTGLNRPFNDYVRAQNENLTLQRLSLQGRDDEAAVLQDALRLQQQGSTIDRTRLATILQNVRAQEAISRALDDQRRIIGLYTQVGSEFQQSFGSFLDRLNDNPGDAFKGLAGDLVGSFTKLRNNILSEQLFGGIDRDIEDYMRRASGQKTPAEILTEHADDAGTALESGVDRIVSSLDRLGVKLDATPPRVTEAGSGAAQDFLLGSYAPLPTGLPGGDGVGIDYLKLTAANDNGVLGIDTAATKFLSATEVFSFAGTRLVDNFTRLFGIELPADLKKSLGDGLGAIISGASYGQLGGGVFASITGGKNNKLTSSIGGILGQEAGKSLAKGVTGLFGKALGPLGGIVGGVLGGLLGGLFAPTPKASAGIVVDKFGVLQGGKATGSSAELRSGAATLAGSVASAVQQIADQLGANVTGNSDVKIGTYKGKFRINTTGGAIGGVKGSGAIEFETEQQAIAAAVSAVLQDGVLSGISAASLKILASGQDLQRALAKATSIEAIPKQLKAYLDPVGAAIDEVNRKYKKLVDALEEGGATAEQRAQAEQLYNLELAETKAKTATASAALKDFLNDLKIGSNSPFSLRDQEATARAQLAPFLNQIAAGSSIDQAKFEDAARAFLDVNRQLFGSTNAYFDALALVQDATNKAIAGIDNVKSVAPDVANPFAKSTAEATATTADRVQTGNEIMSQVSDTLRNVEALLDQIANDNNTRFSSFIGETRSFGIAS